MYTINCNATTEIKKKAVANKVMREIKENHKKPLSESRRRKKEKKKGTR